MSGVKRDCQHPRSRHEHGSVQAYNKDRCRCADCRAEIARDARERYRRRAMARHGVCPPLRIDGTGTRRRLEALAALGWYEWEIAARLGVTRQSVTQLRDDRMHYPASVAAVRAVYDELSMTVPPPDKYRYRSRQRAALHGYLPPLAWDDEYIDDPAAQPMTSSCTSSSSVTTTDSAVSIDEIAVQRAIHGDRVRLNRAEVSSAIATMTGMGMSAREIAERLHTSERNVQRRRAVA